MVTAITHHHMPDQCGDVVCDVVCLANVVAMARARASGEPDAPQLENALANSMPLAAGNTFFSAVSTNWM